MGTSKPEIRIIPVSQIDRVRSASLDEIQKLSLIADMCRANALSAVKRAGSGHLGSSFSAMEIVTWLYEREMNVREVGIDSPDRDIYFSSKGHDVPGLYAVLFSHGIIPKERFIKLRRLGGLDGHPDVGIPGLEANSGSLGMGLSKGRGMSWGKRFLGLKGRVFVMTGDGELQEGQNFEALQAAIHQGVENLTMLVDYNKVQSDKLVEQILSLGDLEAKLKAFGWHVERCDGHDFSALASVFERLRGVNDRPKALIADTIKGRGVSFMEHPRALEDGNGYYKWHAGAPDDDKYAQGLDEILGRVASALESAGLGELETEVVPPVEDKVLRNALGEPVSAGAAAGAPLKKTAEYVVDEYGKALVDLGEARPKMVVLDADLAADCRTRSFELTYPDRYIQNGIAEQDMASMAGGLAHQGLLPVVNSFASFLASRANEQIYNNASEKTKIIYGCHYAGMIPAGPGKSHQSIRDISLLASLPNMVVVQPANGEETRQVLQYCLDTCEDSATIRLAIGPSPRRIELGEGYRLQFGRGTPITEGKDAILFAYGPVMLHEALTASELLWQDGFGLKVVNMPWLNRVDLDWLESTIGGYDKVCVLEDHAPVGGLGDAIMRALAPKGGRRIETFAVEGYPACGTPAEALSAHGLDGASLAQRVRS